MPVTISQFEVCRIDSDDVGLIILDLTPGPPRRLPRRWSTSV